MRPIIFFLSVLAISGPVHAQDLSIEEMTEKLKEHADLYQKKHTYGLTRSATPFGDTRSAGFFAVEAENVESEDPAVQNASKEYAVMRPDLQLNVLVNFDLNSSALRADQKPNIDKVCAAIKESDLDVFRVVGHTDQTGSEAHNKTLSQERADTVKLHMVENCGLPATKLQAVGFGETFLLDDKDPASPDHRRVEFQGMG